MGCLDPVERELMTVRCDGLVGNLPFKVTVEQITAHFASCGMCFLCISVVGSHTI